MRKSRDSHDKSEKSVYITPAPPVDIGKSLSGFHKMAKDTVRLHPRREKVIRSLSRIGGAFLWPKNEEWPTCTEHDCAYVGIIQLFKDDAPELEFPKNSDLFQLLLCPNVHSASSSPDAQVIWRHTSQSENQIDIPFVPAKMQKQYYPLLCSIHPEQVVEYKDGGELSQDDLAAVEKSKAISDAVIDPGIPAIENWDVPQSNVDMYFSWLSVAPGIKLGGHPRWIQDPFYPKCQRKHTMELLVSFATVEFDGLTWGRWLPVSDRSILSASYTERENVQTPTGCTFGGSGTLYIFICRQCEDWPIHSFMQS